MNIKIVASKDFLFIRSKRKSIVVCGYLIGKKHSSSVQQAMNKILNYLHNTNQSYSLSISSNYIRLYVYFILPSFEETISNVRKFLTNFAIIERFNNNVIISQLNYDDLREEFELLLSPIKPTSDPRIFAINKYYFSVASIVLHSSVRSSFQDFLKLVIQNSVATISISRVLSSPVNSQNNKKSHYYNRILLKIQEKSFLNAQESLKNLEEFLLHFKNQMSLTIHFQTLKLLKSHQLQFALGIGHKNCKNFNWFGNLNLSEYLHDFSVTELPKIAKIQKKLHTCNPTSLQTKKIMTASHVDESDNEIKSHVNTTSSYEPLIPYGKKLSKDQIKKMIDTIPLPP
ncbi:MAG: hypothetical protein ACTSYD_03545 [Candidatus Heimdallarchaeaceae archaeon]